MLYVEVLGDVARDPHVVYPEELDHLRRRRDVARSARAGHPQPARAAGGVAAESGEYSYNDNARVEFLNFDYAAPFVGGFLNLWWRQLVTSYKLLWGEAQL